MELAPTLRSFIWGWALPDATAWRGLWPSPPLASQVQPGRHPRVELHKARAPNLLPGVPKAHLHDLRPFEGERIAAGAFQDLCHRYGRMLLGPQGALAREVLTDPSLQVPRGSYVPVGRAALAFEHVDVSPCMKPTFIRRWHLVTLAWYDTWEECNESCAGGEKDLRMFREPFCSGSPAISLGKILSPARR